MFGSNDKWELLWLGHIQFCKASHAVMFFLERGGTPFQQAILVQSFANCIRSWTLKSNIPTEACRIWDAALGFVLFWFFLSINTICLWGEFSGMATFRRWSTVSNVFSLWTIFLTAEFWTSNCLKMALIPHCSNNCLFKDHCWCLTSFALAPELSSFIHALTFADDQLIMCYLHSQYLSNQ